MDTKPTDADTVSAQEPDIIVNKTAHFVGEWIDEHKAEAAAAIPAEIAAEKLAEQCIADAEGLGILAEDIGDEVGDLKQYIAETVLGDETSSNGKIESPPDPLPAAPNGETNAEVPF
ncbi:DUF768 domain-containing protein [Mesorhizobium sp. M1A.F.Ca.IN.022.07.1.1]|uniref:DUF768 domain-containing protein n=1 Tax=unclassified Mesorhizobium TaxID=325217 RepID=UPI000BB0A319|nr:MULTISPECIES: DUF768 domain-containing protein [unclassified Mesorhizobium]RUV05861.1 DUF768 domain-containing protein [Mesorhizobium sp. M1A.F.Ca.IN.020.03.2.1]RUV88309.1 DUF768 domain-containing protein [Mesorhizobium sp. M1A.F.Ca.IN.020.32.1.1]RUW14267.1 DUF768 domain-containing protein [Mesorhizobium sp. M1A.F.Ca.IN.022.05.2.1]RUW29888.1 DUF768 domain-containing protein [Mesorhizobium sp. M1A.F.Ca.IN.020.06.1.1]WIE91492.1 DUF768 domain-containing protein [Mesorhizobium sp. WSM4875]